MPIYCATGSRLKAFTYSSFYGIAEPTGDPIGYFLLRAYISESAFGIIFATVAGIMVFISLDELLTAAQRCGEHHLCIVGLVAGMGMMALSPRTSI